MALQKSDSDLARDDPAPEFELPGADGGTYSPEDFADREALLVVFTCNHCPYAKAKIDPLNAIAREYDEVAVVGINANDAEAYAEDSFERMKELVADGTVEYDAYLRDESQEVARAYGAVCTPDPFLFERQDGEKSRSSERSSGSDPRDGEFRLAYHGRIDDAHDPDAEPTEHDLREAIEQLLAGESVTVEEQPSRGCSIKWRDTT
ncbi:thioredoxin family protein [Halalkalicoccus subterraneus]|uniref:thioredoxin family protein n=1 Tax=Halalkalicoccus subterraneus TaxID=2675002 RepID=UPI000EFD1A57|nr:thioredoxin family protein [Halalkalicoccus subterraneus]